MNAFIRSWVVPSIAVLALSVAGCEDKPTVVADDAGVVDSGPPKPVLGGKLGAAVAAAESAQAAPRSSAGAANGPPETGIFAPGAANAAHPPNTPAKVEVLGEGSDPKIALALSPKDEQRAVLSVSVRLGPQSALPSIDFGLLFKLDKPKAKDDKSKGDSDKAGPVQVIATVAAATLAKEQPGQLPKELADAIAKLKGTEIRYQLTPEGAIVNLTATLSKDSDDPGNPGLKGLTETTIKALTETITLMTVPLPQKPLGVGGYWMVTDRSASVGVEVVRYRVFKVEKIEQGHATLSLTTRQYAAKGEIDLGAASNGVLPFDRFESQGKGSIEWTAGALLPPNSQVLQGLAAQAGGPKGGPARGLQIEMSSKSSEPEKSDKKK
jgi:hypothetical protein